MVGAARTRRGPPLLCAGHPLYHGRTDRHPHVDALPHSRTLTSQFMTIFQALVLGVLQGLAEFLPISSSAHLALAPWLFGWKEPGLAFDVALHVGTLAAVLVYFRAEWMRLTAAAWRMLRTVRVDTDEQRRVIFLI